MPFTATLSKSRKYLCELFFSPDLLASFPLGQNLDLMFRAHPSIWRHIADPLLAFYHLANIECRDYISDFYISDFYVHFLAVMSSPAQCDDFFETFGYQHDCITSQPICLPTDRWPLVPYMLGKIKKEFTQQEYDCFVMCLYLHLRRGDHSPEEVGKILGAKPSYTLQEIDEALGESFDRRHRSYVAEILQEFPINVSHDYSSEILWILLDKAGPMAQKLKDYEECGTVRYVLDATCFYQASQDGKVVDESEARRWRTKYVNQSEVVAQQDQFIADYLQDQPEQEQPEQAGQTQKKKAKGKKSKMVQVSMLAPLGALMQNQCNNIIQQSRALIEQDLIITRQLNEIERLKELLTQHGIDS